MFRLENETEEDKWEVEGLLDVAFGPGRFALSAYRLREGVKPVLELSVLARDEFGSVSGSIRFWPVRAGEDGNPALLLGPVAVHPTRQGEGLGSLLITDGLERARSSGWKAVFLIGDEPYYSRFGFVRCPEVAFPAPTDPARILVNVLDSAEVGPISGEIRKWQSDSNWSVSGLLG